MVEEISEKDSETRNGSIRLQLHDCLALGEFEKGLDLSSAFSSDNDLDVTKTSNEQVGSTDEEIHRLPLLLRLLHASRPLSSIPTFTDCGSELLRKHDDYDANGEDQLIGEVVARLEERAAAYSAAEGVQVVACHLAPTVTKSVSRFPPLQAIMIQSNKINMTTHIRGSLDVIYDTALLEETVLDMSTSACLVGGNISANGRKKGEKRKLVSSLDTGDAEDGALVSTDSENEMEVEVRDSKNKGRKRVRSESKHDSLENNMVSEDSQEFAIVKTMQELLQLTLQGLKQSPSNSFNFAGKTIDDEGETGGIVANNDNSALSITMHDSVLAAGARSHHQREMGGISDLGSTIVSLMHHIPCLRHRHLAVSYQVF